MLTDKLNDPKLNRKTKKRFNLEVNLRIAEKERTEILEKHSLDLLGEPSPIKIEIIQT